MVPAEQEAAEAGEGAYGAEGEEEPGAGWDSVTGPDAHAFDLGGVTHAEEPGAGAGAAGGQAHFHEQQEEVWLGADEEE